jgi:hypothetical protein
MINLKKPSIIQKQNTNTSSTHYYPDSIEYIILFFLYSSLFVTDNLINNNFIPSAIFIIESVMYSFMPQLKIISFSSLLMMYDVRKRVFIGLLI